MAGGEACALAGKAGGGDRRRTSGQYRGGTDGRTEAGRADCGTGTLAGRALWGPATKRATSTSAGHAVNTGARTDWTGDRTGTPPDRPRTENRQGAGTPHRTPRTPHQSRNPISAPSRATGTAAKQPPDTYARQAAPTTPDQPVHTSPTEAAHTPPPNKPRPTSPAQAARKAQ
ncbi:hypothetical protein OG496_28640 [Streptomyces sp. NBC_00988]|uniref:hypothetical protein n=1 Tax=Streptomyces sp. NBC_00988 TaxID=2903704 RepID=UPI00386C0FED|nr:hypothetical protein OG496_28640 [Streptomyces sp. NBC_00988]